MINTSINKHKFFKELKYTPHGGQKKFHDSEARFRVACCGRRYGKSTMAARDVQPALFLHDKLYWIVGPTYDLGEKEFRIMYDDLVRHLGMGKDRRIRKGYNKRSGTLFLEFPWNTKVEVRSADNPESLVGESLDGVIMAEAAKHKRDTWERYIRPALADKQGFGVFCTTPEGHNWIYDLYMLGQDDDFPDYESWRMPSWENTIVFPGGRNDPEILQMERTTTPEWFAQEIGASFTSFVGKIFPEFDEQIHVKNHTFNPMWPNYGFWDWGYVNALVFIEAQITPRDEVIIWREHYQPWLRLEEHLEEIKARPNPEGYRLDGTYGDAADPEAVATVNEKFASCIALPEAKENWRFGIEVHKRFLKPYNSGFFDEYDDPIMKANLYVDPSCKNTIKEYQNYKMASPTRAGNDPQEKPVKKNDHAMDAIRYGLMHIFELGAKYHLEDVLDHKFKQTAKISHLEPSGVERGIFTRENLRF